MSDSPRDAKVSTEDSDFTRSESLVKGMGQVVALWLLMFIYAGDPAPAVNEAHYLVKAKNYWDASYCANDLFAASGKAHTTFYLTFGWLTRFVSLEATAWIGRAVGWLLLAVGLRACCRSTGLTTWASLAVLVLWVIGIERGNLAGEWVVGGIEGKVPAYGLALLGLSRVMRDDWRRAWICFGAASAFHVLTGGWSVIAASVAYVVMRIREPGRQQRVPLASMWKGLFIGGALSLFGLIPAIALTMDADPSESTLAARIYSYVRLRHHLLPGDFPWHWYARHAVLVISLFLTLRLPNRSLAIRRVQSFALGALLIAAAGLVVGCLPGIAPDLAAKLLRYYWFRLSDAVVPLALALVIVEQCSAQVTRNRVLASLVTAFGIIAFISSVYGRVRQGVPPSARHDLLGIRSADVTDQQRSFQDWCAVCNWISVAMPEDEVLLTPRHQQTFKWYAGRAEVVNWKDVPQDAESLIQWYERFEDVFPKRIGRVRLGSTRVPISYDRLRSYRDHYGVRFLLVDTRAATSNLPLIKVYPAGEQKNETYHVYELPLD